MKKYILVLILLLAFSTQSFAQVRPEVSLTKTFYILEGTINNKYPITMHLTIEENTKKVEGQYYYNNIGTLIYLGESILDQKSKLSLKEFTNTNDAYHKQNSTGQFAGTFDNNKIFQGTWSNGKKSFNFKVEPNKTSAIQKIGIENYTFKENFITTSNSGNFQFSAEIPQIANPKKLSSIKKINKELNNLDNFSIYSEWEGDNVGGVKDGNWFLNSSYDFIFIDNRIISLLYTEMIHSGGAYPNTLSQAIVYSLDSGEVITINDLIYSVEDKKLITLMQQKIREYRRQQSGGEDKNASDEEISRNFYDFNSIRLGDNYSVDSSGITFIYSQGELAAHVFGRIEISFSYDDLKPFVKKNSKLYYLFE